LINTPLIIFGAGGHGHVVLDAALISGRNVLCLLDENPSADDVYGVPIVASKETSRIPAEDWNFVIAVGDNHTRSNLLNQMNTLGGILDNVVHPSSVITTRCQIGLGCVLLAGTIINPGAHIGSNVILNTGSSIDHHCRIGDHVHICPGAKLAGNVSIGEYSMIGMGAVVKPGVTIGSKCIVGAGAVVVSDLPDNSISTGTPAKVIRYQKVNPYKKENEQS
jgi:sugar O-acyltransferase (sialic acid O-acetyltransferase NeuD family)